MKNNLSGAIFVIARYVSTFLVFLMFCLSSAQAQTPCDFKGVTIGDSMTHDEVMQKLNVKSYKKNPDRNSFPDSLSLMKKYGIIPSGEILDWRIGPSCDTVSVFSNSCRIPFGVQIGNNNSIPVSVFVSFSEDKVSSITIKFNQIYWTEVKDMIGLKYGSKHKLEADTLAISDLETHKVITVQNELITYPAGGTNLKTGDKCRVEAGQFDIVFQHHDPLGLYHSYLGLQLISKNM